MDEIDRAIIDILRGDARIPNITLAERVGLTPGPCLRRVQRLEAEGVILGYRTAIAPAALHQTFEVLLDVDLTNYDRDSIDRFESTMVAFDEVLELYRMFGSPDYFVRVAVADLTAYERFLTDKVITVDGIQKVHSRFPMKTLKSVRSTR